jgi:hypothetical protein
MNNHRYTSDPLPELKFDKNRYRVKFCPCGKNNKDVKFVPYVSFENKGYCHSCGETFLPELPKIENCYTSQPAQHAKTKVQPQKPTSYIDKEIFVKSLQLEKDIHEILENNHFLKFLHSQFGIDVLMEILDRYLIGTSYHWDGATVFWQIDKNENVRTGKIMLYSPITGKRVKNLELPVKWVHKALKQPDFKLGQCMFGEHLLVDGTKPVAIVESEKTAAIASVYYPNCIWLAVGGAEGLNAEKLNILKGRTVRLYPDLNKFEKWSSKAREFKHLANFTICDLLELKANDAERKKGLDIADYLLRYDYKEFTQPEHKAIVQPSIVQPLFEVKTFEQPEPDYNFIKYVPPMPASWDNEIKELENYFSEITLPTQPVSLNNCMPIENVESFIESHLAIVKANNGIKVYQPYLNRLQELKEVLITLYHGNTSR